MASTLRDVATRAGVSISTASRMFTRPELFTDATRERVLAAAAELNYKPNRAAQALITGRTGSVAVLVPNLSNPVFPALVRAIQRRLSASRSLTLVADTDESAKTEHELIESLIGDVDGIITCSSLLDGKDAARFSSTANIVFVNRGISTPARCAVVDSRAGMLEVAGRLAELGHQDVAYLAGPQDSWAGRERLTAFLDASRSTGLRASVHSPVAPSFDGGRRAAESIDARLNTAVVCFNDVIAIGLMSGLRELGIRTPHDVSVVGYGDIAMASMTEPTLTTLAPPLTAMGEFAADLILRVGQPSQTEVFALPLVVRQSIGPRSRRPSLLPTTSR